MHCKALLPKLSQWISLGETKSNEGFVKKSRTVNLLDEKVQGIDIYFSLGGLRHVIEGINTFIYLFKSGKPLSNYPNCLDIMQEFSHLKHLHNWNQYLRDVWIKGVSILCTVNTVILNWSNV